METLLKPEQLVADYRSYKLQKATNSREPSQSNRCSELGHPCTAYCVFARTVPVHLRPAISEDLAEIFDEGKKQEQAIQIDLLEMGYQVQRQQETLRWPKYNIVGHKDFSISKGGSPFVRCEFKSVNPYTYEKLNTPEDVRNNNSSWVQKWYSQTVLYMLLDDQKEYWLFLKNKSRGSIKPIVFKWNDQVWEDAEALIKKAEQVNKLVEVGKPPKEELKISTPEDCSHCQFLTVCNPNLDFGVGAQILTEEQAADLSVKLERWEEIKPIAKEFDNLDDELKSEVKSIAVATQTDSVVIGDWLASLKHQNVKAEAAPRKAFTKTLIKFTKLVSSEQVDRTYLKEQGGKSDMEKKLEASLKK